MLKKAERGDWQRVRTILDSARVGHFYHVLISVNVYHCRILFWGIIKSDRWSEIRIELSDLFCRSTRESTPCSLIRDPEVVRTPSSTTRPTTLTETNRRIHNVDGRHIPTTHEMNEFFAGAEEEQQRNFIEKYRLRLSLQLLIWYFLILPLFSHV